MSDNTARDPKEFTMEPHFIDPSDMISDRDAFLQEQNLCCLCGHELNFDHVVDFMQLTVIESASCDPCKIQLRKRLFTLN